MLLPGGKGTARKAGNLARVASVALLVAVAVGLAAFSFAAPVHPDSQQPCAWLGQRFLLASSAPPSPRLDPSKPARSDAPRRPAHAPPALDNAACGSCRPLTLTPPPPQAQPEAMELVSRARQAHMLRRGRRTFAPRMSLAEDGEEAEEEEEDQEGGPPKVTKMDRARREVENDRDYRDLRAVRPLSAQHRGKLPGGLEIED